MLPKAGMHGGSIQGQDEAREGQTRGKIAHVKGGSAIFEKPGGQNEEPLAATAPDEPSPDKKRDQRISIKGAVTTDNPLAALVKHAPRMHTMRKQGHSFDIGKEFFEMDMVEAVQKMEDFLKRAATAQAGLLNPNDDDFVYYWDISIMAALIYTALVTPYEIALISDNKLDFLFVVNRFVDIIFTIDIFVSFRLMYFEDTHLVRDKSKIARRYLRGWFPIDFLSVFPGYVDLYMLASGTEGGQFSHLTFILRLIRLAKMGRILKASRVLVRLRTSINLKNSTINLMRNMVLMVLATHWVACAWLLILELQGTGKVTWLNAYVDDNDVCKQLYSSDTPARLPSDGSAPPDGDYDWAACFSPSRLYTLGLYWSFVNLISGYASWPTGTAEFVYSIVAMAVGGFCWIIIGANITASAVNEGFDIKRYKEGMDQVNEFLSENKVRDLDFGRQLRKYVIFSRNKNKFLIAQDMLRRLSPELGGLCAQYGSEVIVNSKLDWFARIARRLDNINGDGESLDGDNQHQFSAATLDLMLAMQAEIYPPQEHIYEPDTLFIVVKGVCARNGSM
jgi:hypothetical protein